MTLLMEQLIRMLQQCAIVELHSIQDEIELILDKKCYFPETEERVFADGEKKL